jgi:hypothetical protein
MLYLRKDVEEVAEWESILILGTYSEEQTLLSY